MCFASGFMVRISHSMMKGNVFRLTSTKTSIKSLEGGGSQSFGFTVVAGTVVGLSRF